MAPPLVFELVIPGNAMPLLRPVRHRSVPLFSGPPHAGFAFFLAFFSQSPYYFVPTRQQPFASLPPFTLVLPPIPPFDVFLVVVELGTFNIADSARFFQTQCNPPFRMLAAPPLYAIPLRLSTYFFLSLPLTPPTPRRARFRIPGFASRPGF